MLAPANRLRSSREIGWVYKRGSYGAGSGELSVKAVKTTRSLSRAVVVVGRKVDKRAVVRNRIRRRLLAVLREDWGTVTPGYDIVVNVHRDLSAAPVATLRQYLHRALSRALDGGFNPRSPRV